MIGFLLVRLQLSDVIFTPANLLQPSDGLSSHRHLWLDHFHVVGQDASQFFLHEAVMSASKRYDVDATLQWFLQGALQQVPHLWSVDVAGFHEVCQSHHRHEEHVCVFRVVATQPIQSLPKDGPARGQDSHTSACACGHRRFQRRFHADHRHLVAKLLSQRFQSFRTGGVARHHHKLASFFHHLRATRKHSVAHVRPVLLAVWEVRRIRHVSHVHVCTQTLQCRGDGQSTNA
mmetsp:Transcript_6842/g.41734  ORF Transcript_6842/g.41734 Transcript_6842/m.41734 type:complete len:232 (-) Transcript_6842:191-886(-)